MPRWPLDGNIVVTQEFGSKAYVQPGFVGHTGIDLATYYGQLVKAPAPIVAVVYAGFDLTGFGNLVMGKDPWGYTHLFAHNASLNVRVGSQVPEGGVLSYSNSTGNSTGNHLHWEVWPPNRNRYNGYNGGINPRDWLAATSGATNVAVTPEQFTEDWTRLAYLWYLGRDPSTAERRSILEGGIAWPDAINRFKGAPERPLRIQMAVTAVYQMTQGASYQYPMSEAQNWAKTDASVAQVQAVAYGDALKDTLAKGDVVLAKRLADALAQVNKLQATLEGR